MLADMIGGERRLHRLIAHALAGRIGHFGFLKMEPGFRKVTERAGVIKVHMRDDEIIEIVGINIDLFEDLARQHLNLASATGGFFVLEAGIDNDCAVFVADHPDEIVDRPRTGMVVVVHEIEVARTVDLCAVFQGEDLIGLGGHGQGSQCAAGTKWMMRPDRARVEGQAARFLAFIVRSGSGSTTGMLIDQIRDDH